MHNPPIISVFGYKSTQILPVIHARYVEVNVVDSIIQQEVMNGRSVTDIWIREGLVPGKDIKQLGLARDEDGSRRKILLGPQGGLHGLGHPLGIGSKGIPAKISEVLGPSRWGRREERYEIDETEERKRDRGKKSLLPTSAQESNEFETSLDEVDEQERQQREQKPLVRPYRRPYNNNEHTQNEIDPQEPFSEVLSLPSSPNDEYEETQTHPGIDSDLLDPQDA
jgi:hypothetical protein